MVLTGATTLFESGNYLDYRPNNTACTNGQILSYNTTNSRWQCGTDSQGVSGTGVTNSLTKWTLSGAVVVLTGATTLFESGNYLDYRPNNTACTNGQILSYNTTNSRWQCGTDSQGVSGSGVLNAVTKWTSSGSVTTLTGSSILFDSGSNIGIRTSIPDYGLTVL